MFYKYIFTDFQFYFFWILVVVLSVCLHELAHAVAAYYEGDSTAKEQGYFTLNPLVHMGGASLLILTLFGLAWGACPVNPSRFKHKYGDALVSAAGPLANLTLVFLFLLLLLVFKFVGEQFLPVHVVDNILRFLQIGASANAMLFIFNLIPVPPLDGSTVVQSFFPKMTPIYNNIGNYGFLAIFLLFWIPGFSRLLWGTADFICENVLTLYLAALTGLAVLQ